MGAITAQLTCRCCHVDLVSCALRAPFDFKALCGLSNSLARLRVLGQKALPVVAAAEAPKNVETKPEYRTLVLSPSGVRATSTAVHIVFFITAVPIAAWRRICSWQK